MSGKTDVSPEAVERLIEGIKRDREAGTPGPWVVGKDADEDQGFGWFVGGGGYCRADIVGPIIHTEANARRIARVPDMEALIIAQAARIAELEAERDTARAEALQEAVEVAESFGYAVAVKDAITALIEKEG